jgi:hypothetical protein
MKLILKSASLLIAAVMLFSCGDVTPESTGGNNNSGNGGENTELPDDLTPETWGYYGKDRQDTAMEILRRRDEHFVVEDGLEILQKTRQTGAWATRVSFVYHSGENAVYYCQQGNFDRITRHFFAG